jgi:hypothetical protein
MTSATEPLVKGQQLFLQRLLAAHCFDDDQALMTFKELKPAMDGACENLNDCLSQINTQLTKGFGLEVATVSIKEDGVFKQFHAIINTQQDKAAKDAFQSQSFDLNDRAFLRLVYEKLAEDGTCQRSVLINLRTELKDNVSLSMARADHLIETLLEEKWLVVTQADEEAGGTQNSRRRESVHAAIGIGPRSFLELSHYLQDLGYPEEDLPQFLFHRE